MDIFTADDVRRWPAGALQGLLEMRILREVSWARSLYHDDCERGCLITPDVRKDPRSGRMVGVHFCPREGGGRITIEAELLRQWQFQPEGLAVALGAAANLAPSVTHVVKRRLFLLGQLPTNRGPVDVFLAFSLARGWGYDMVMKTERLISARFPVLIVPDTAPLPTLYPILRPTVLRLAESVSWNEAESVPDFSRVVAALRSVRPPVPADQWLTVSQCAELLTKDLPYLDLKKASSRVSRAASAGKFATNEKKHDARRIERTSFDAWRLAQRNRDLDEEEV